MAGLRERGLDDALRDRVDDGPADARHLPRPPARARASRRRTAASPGSGSCPAGRCASREGRVPRIGWAEVEPSGEAFYFAHSYAAETPAATACSEGIVAIAEAGSFLGVQFHPEKSGAAGARFLERCLSRA